MQYENNDTRKLNWPKPQFHEGETIETQTTIHEYGIPVEQFPSVLHPLTTNLEYPKGTQGIVLKVHDTQTTVLMPDGYVIPVWPSAEYLWKSTCTPDAP